MQKVEWNGEPILDESKWGRDHWSLLLYCEDRAVNQGGRLDLLHLRRSSQRTPSPTRLADRTQLSGHDDTDVLEELRVNGYLEVFDTGLSRVRLTDKGWKTAHRLRRERGES